VHRESRIIAIAMLATACGDASAWRLDYTLEAGFLHSDNINLSPVDAVSEDVLIPHLDFDLTHAGSRVNVDVGGVLEYREYLQDTYGSEFRGAMNGRVNWLLLPERLTWTFADNLGLYPVSLRLPDVPGNLQQTNVFSTGPTLRFRFTPSLQGQAEARWSDSHAEETGAFEEFLFNMTSEELATLRRAMQQQHLSAASPAWAAEILGRQIEELEHSHEIDPMALYRSYQRRQLAADFRLMSGAPGPRRTAEGYLMVYLLDQQ
jgi:hypothetical protein